jgi:hypothetical protein
MNMRQWLWLVLLLLGLGLTACNGSGSSGFDGPNIGEPMSPGPGGPLIPIDREVEEEAMINRLLQTQRCLELPQLLLCPIDVMEPPGSAASVVTDLPPDGVVTCTPHTPGVFCSVPLNFFPDGFPADTVFRLATHPLDLSSPWLLGPEPVATGTPEAPQFAATAVVRLPHGGVSISNPSRQYTEGDATRPAEGFTIRLAVLAWSASAAPQWRTLGLLAHSEADWVFIGEWRVKVEL